VLESKKAANALRKEKELEKKQSQAVQRLRKANADADTEKVKLSLFLPLSLSLSRALCSAMRFREGAGGRWGERERAAAFVLFVRTLSVTSPWPR
jgi:hypothetical protein